MLVLSRRIGDTIYIDKDIALVVVDIQNGRVKLGIAAPRDVVVMRSELLPTDDPRHRIIETTTSQ